MRQLWAVWGVGPAAEPLIREGMACAYWPSPAREYADLHPDWHVWCVEVYTYEETIDAATRYDASVTGWVAV